MTHERRERHRPVLWWVLGAVPGAVVGLLVGAAVYGWILDPLFFSDADGLEDLAPAILGITAALTVGTVGGAIAGGRTLMRWNARRSAAVASPPGAPEGAARHPPSSSSARHRGRR